MACKLLPPLNSPSPAAVFRRCIALVILFIVLWPNIAAQRSMVILAFVSIGRSLLYLNTLSGEELTESRKSKQLMDKRIETFIFFFPQIIVMRSIWLCIERGDEF